MSKKSYIVLVMGSVYGTQNASSAFLFCRAIIQLKHILHSVFFYCDGVLNANNLNSPASDEFDLTKAWQKLNVKYNVKLYVCISSALRRGVIKNEDISKISLKKNNLARFFKISGLMELAYSIKKCDRIIQF